MDDLNAPATKGDLEKFATRDDLQKFATKDDLQKFATKDDLQKFATRDDLQKLATTDNLQQLEERLTEGMRDIQTELLKAFYSFAKSADAKLQDAEISDHLIRLRVSAVESRLTEIERRLNMPPAA